MYFEHLFHRRKLKKKKGGGELKFAIFENFTNNGESIREINEGSRE